MKIQRIPSKPNKNTFSIPPIRKWIEEHLVGSEITIDPFARHSKIAHWTNDINPECGTDFCMDALDFLRKFDDEEVDAVLFDPPYSLRQLKECYDGLGRDLTSHESKYFFSDLRNEIARVLRPGGVGVSFGW